MSKKSLNRWVSLFEINKSLFTEEEYSYWINKAISSFGTSKSQNILDEYRHEAYVKYTGKTTSLIHVMKTNNIKCVKEFSEYIQKLESYKPGKELVTLLSMAAALS